MKLSSRVFFVLPMLAVLAVLPRRAAAQVSTWGGSNGNWDVPANWTSGTVPASGAIIDSGTALLPVSVTGEGGGMIVGESGTGAVSVSGGMLNSIGATLGDGAGSSGTMTVSSGTWYANYMINVGGSGSGTLQLNGGLVSVNFENMDGTVNVGLIAGSNGSVVLQGGTLSIYLQLNVGVSGSGSLNMEGGNATTNDVVFGYNPGGVGTGTVSGGTLSANFYVVVGSTGNGVSGGSGSLLIDGGYVTGGNGVIGDQPGASGTATVTSGTWHNFASFNVGNNGNGVLNLEGGMVSAANTVIGEVNVNNLSEGGNGMANVTSGSWVNSASLTVGSMSGTGVLNVNGGYVSDVNGFIGTGTIQSGPLGGLDVATVTGGTWASSGTLMVGDAFSTGSLAVNGGYVSSGTAIIDSGTGQTPASVMVSGGTWANSGTLIVGNSGTGVLDISGSGVVTAGNGILLASGTGSAGTLNLSGGTITAGGITGGSGAAVVNINVSGTATYLTGFSGTLNVNVNPNGGGTVIMGGNGGSYTGTTTIGNGATLQLGGGTTFGTVNGTLVNNGLLVLDGNGAIAATSFSGTGSLEVIAGSVQLSGTPSYTGSTFVKSGALAAVAGSTPQNFGIVDVGVASGDNGRLTLGLASGTYNIANITVGDSGSGLLIISAPTVNIGSGTGTLLLANAVGSSGTLSIGTYARNSISTLNAAAVTGGSGAATVQFSPQTAGTFAPLLEGSLSVIQIASGTTVLTGSNSYTGSTNISAGVLQIGNGILTGSMGTGMVVNSGTLVFDPGGQEIVPNSISGAGVLRMTGPGSTTLTGSNSYSGTTTVSAGTLTMNGVNTSSPTVVNGGVLNGSGTTGSITVNSGGTLAGTLHSGAVAVNAGGMISPGNSPGADVMTSLSLSGSATYHAEIAAPGGGSYAGPGNHPIGGTDYDQTTLTGTNNGVSETALTLDPANSILRLNVTGVLPAGGVAATGGGYNPTGSNSTLDNYFILNLSDTPDVVSGKFLQATLDGLSFTTIDYSSGNLVGNSSVGTFTLGGDEWAISYAGDSGSNSTTGGNDVVLTALMAVPEPGSCALLALGAAGMVMARRRRRRAEE